MVDANSDAIRAVPSEGDIQSPLGQYSSDYLKTFTKVSKLPAADSMETVLAFSKGHSLPPRGRLNFTF